MLLLYPDGIIQSQCTCVHPLAELWRRLHQMPMTEITQNFKHMQTSHTRTRTPVRGRWQCARTGLPLFGQLDRSKLKSLSRCWPTHAHNTTAVHFITAVSPQNIFSSAWLCCFKTCKTRPNTKLWGFLHDATSCNFTTHVGGERMMKHRCMRLWRKYHALIQTVQITAKVKTVYCCSPGQP